MAAITGIPNFADPGVLPLTDTSVDSAVAAVVAQVGGTSFSWNTGASVTAGNLDTANFAIPPAGLNVAHKAAPYSLVEFSGASMANAVTAVGATTLLGTAGANAILTGFDFSYGMVDTAKTLSGTALLKINNNTVYTLTIPAGTAVTALVSASIYVQVYQGDTIDVYLTTTQSAGSYVKDVRFSIWGKSLHVG